MPRRAALWAVCAIWYGKRSFPSGMISGLPTTTGTSLPVSIRSARYGRGPVSGVLAGGAGFLAFLGEDALPVPVQGVEVDVLDGQGVLVVAVELAASLGAACVDPVRGPVAGAVEPVCLDEGLGEDGGVAVGVLPVGGQPAGDPAQDRGGEVRDADVGQDEEAGVAGDEVQPGFAGGGVPADAGVAGGAFPG